MEEDFFRFVYSNESQKKSSGLVVLEVKSSFDTCYQADSCSACVQLIF